MRSGWVIGLALGTLCGCANDVASPPLASGPRLVAWHVAAPEAMLAVTLAADEDVIVTLDGLDSTERLVEMDATALAGAQMVIDGWEPTSSLPDAVWWYPRRTRGVPGPIRLHASAPTTATLRLAARATPPDAVIERSLTWTDPAIVEDPATVGLARVMRAASDDAHGGALFDWMLREFGRTLHSERPALVSLADRLALTFGADPTTWDLDRLPFRVTAVHSRLDLRSADHCGELRVSMTCTDPDFQHVHFIFLFHQDLGDDVAITGERHCAGTAFRLASLSALSNAELAAAARAILDETLVHERFRIAESLERTVATWEWRQWQPTPNTATGTAGRLPNILTNPPLFQTVDPARVNPAGARRDAFLAWVAANADDIAARRILVPTDYGSASMRAAEGVPRMPLDLSGLAPALASRTEELRSALDTTGCPGCHARSPTFLQTNADRTFSPFYALELDARARVIDAFRDAPQTAPAAHFGALAD